MGLNIVVGLEIFYPQINGIITTTMNLMQNFQKMGHNPLIVTPQVVKGAPPMVEGIPIHYISSTNAFVYPGLRLINHRSRIFTHIVNQHNTDIIHNTAPWFIAKGLNNVAVKKHIPLINVFHTNLHTPGYIQHIAPFTHKIILNYLTKIVWHTYKPFLRPNDVIVAPNPHTCSDITKHFPNKRVEWIPNGLAIQQFRENLNEALLPTLIPSSHHNKPYAIFVGRHAKEKSIDVLIKAVAETVKQIPDFYMVLVGDGPQFKQLTHLAERLNLIDKNITFLGKIQHEFLIKSSVIHKARFFVTASITETHSMTVTESICCGTPIIAPDDPSMTFFAKEAGLFFTPHDPAAMSAAMVQMWKNDDVYRTKKQGAINMLASFDGKKIAEQYLALYYELLEQKRSKSNAHRK